MFFKMQPKNSVNKSQEIESRKKISHNQEHGHHEEEVHAYIVKFKITQIIRNLT